jgi:hypothetical protein
VQERAGQLVVTHYQGFALVLLRAGVRDLMLCYNENAMNLLQCDKLEFQFYL